MKLLLVFLQLRLLRQRSVDANRKVLLPRRKPLPLQHQSPKRNPPRPPRERNLWLRRNLRRKRRRLLR